jgi:hypothetical protein
VVQPPPNSIREDANVSLPGRLEALIDVSSELLRRLGSPGRTERQLRALDLNNRRAYFNIDSTARSGLRFEVHIEHLVIREVQTSEQQKRADIRLDVRLGLVLLTGEAFDDPIQAECQGGSVGCLCKGKHHLTEQPGLVVGQFEMADLTGAWGATHIRWEA